MSALSSAMTALRARLSAATRAESAAILLFSLSGSPDQWKVSPPSHDSTTWPSGGSGKAVAAAAMAAASSDAAAEDLLSSSSG